MGRTAAGARCAPGSAARARASSVAAIGAVRSTLGVGALARRGDLVQVRRRGAGARDGACCDERAEAGGLDDGGLVVELLASQALRPPPGEEPPAERIARADGVDDL